MPAWRWSIEKRRLSKVVDSCHDEEEVRLVLDSLEALQKSIDKVLSLQPEFDLLRKVEKVRLGNLRALFNEGTFYDLKQIQGGE
jgi:hypothetical protein